MNRFYKNTTMAWKNKFFSDQDSTLMTWYYILPLPWQRRFCTKWLQMYNTFQKKLSTVKKER